MLCHSFLKGKKINKSVNRIKIRTNIGRPTGYCIYMPLGLLRPERNSDEYLKLKRTVQQEVTRLLFDSKGTLETCIILFNGSRLLTVEDLSSNIS
jgi:hypothetical protein